MTLVRNPLKFFFLAFFLLGSCSPAIRRDPSLNGLPDSTVRKVTVRVIRPAPINLLDIGGSTLGVVQFKGPAGFEIADRLASQLAELGDFQVYDPTTMHDRLDMLGISKEFETKAVSLRWMHENTAVDVLISGEVKKFEATGYETIKDTFVLEGSGEEEFYITDFGLLSKREKMVQRKVPLFCRTDQGSVAAVYTVWDARTGSQIGEVERSLSSDMPSFCYREDVPEEVQLSARHRLLQRLFVRLNEEFISQITPEPMRDLYDFEVVSTMVDSELGRRNELGILSASRGKWQQAEDVWHELVYENPDMSAAHYNLGLVYRATARLTTASQELSKAFSLEPKPLYVIAIEDLKQFRQRAKK